MRYIKSILLALAVAIIIVAGIGFLLKPEYKIERSIIIKASSGKIFPYLSDLKKWPEWSAWNKHKDPSLQLTYAGPEKGVGSKQKWKGDALDEGEIEITRLVEGKELEYSLLLEEDFKSKGTLLLEPQGQRTKISWKVEGNVGNNIPQRYFILFIDKFISPDLEESLNGLKKICERE